MQCYDDVFGITSISTHSFTAYAETKAQSRLINQFIEDSPTKFKRLIQSATPEKK